LEREKEREGKRGNRRNHKCLLFKYLWTLVRTRKVSVKVMRQRQIWVKQLYTFFEKSFILCFWLILKKKSFTMQSAGKPLWNSWKVSIFGVLMFDIQRNCYVIYSVKNM
jgi:hypothetical protein